MDKQQKIGYLLIGLLFIAFWWLNKPTEEQMAAHQRYVDSVRNAQAELLRQQADMESELHKELTEGDDSTRLVKAKAIYGDFAQFLSNKEEKITLQNDLLTLQLSSQGGRVISAKLNEFKNYQDQSLILFEEKDAQFGFQLEGLDGRSINTKDLNFAVKSQNANSVCFSLATENGSLDFTYTLPANSYMVNFDVKAEGDFQSRLKEKNLKTSWSMKIAQQEKGRKQEERYSQLYYFTEDDDYEYLSETSNDTENPSELIKWVAFKDQFFSSVLIADSSAMFRNTSLNSVVLTDSSQFMKSFKAEMEVPFEKAVANMRFYFGPNDYYLLKSFDDNSDYTLKLKRLVPMGAFVIRWINQLLYVPMFKLFGSFLTNYGLIIFLMTLVVKLLIFPFTYKTYLNSAKMKALKPQIDKINEKIPAENQMERSQAMMDLYRSAGVSPFGGCMPMLLQMPFLVALFYFFPNAIDLRGESFLWADDLSTYDAILSWNTEIPVLSYMFGNHISLFCLLMTALNVVYTMINMNMTDNGQMQQMPFMKYMMYFMPIMFLFIFNEYASGLTYYYFVSLLITILQTYIIRKFMVDEKALLAKIEENQKNPKKPSASSWLKKVEEMQKRVVEEQKKREAEDASKK